jgi:hypothetical protein
MTQLELMPVRLPGKGTMTRELLMALKNGERLTPLIALQKYSCFSLSQRMGELKRAGWPICSEIVEVQSGKRVACYWMPEGESYA